MNASYFDMFCYMAIYLLDIFLLVSQGLQAVVASGKETKRNNPSAMPRAPPMCRKCKVLRKGHKCPYKNT